MRCEELSCDEYTRIGNRCHNHRLSAKTDFGGAEQGLASSSDPYEAVKVEETGIGAAKIWTKSGAVIEVNAKGLVSDKLAQIFTQGAHVEPAAPEVEEEKEEKHGVAPVALPAAGVISSGKPALAKNDSFIDHGMTMPTDRSQTSTFVKELPVNAKPSFTVGDGTKGHTQTHLNKPYGVAFVPAYPHLMITTTKGSHQVRIYDQSQAGDSEVRDSRLTDDAGCLFCVGGLETKHSGHLDGEFNEPWGVAVTLDSQHVLIVDKDNDRVQVFTLIVTEDGNAAKMEFKSTIGSGKGKQPGQVYLT
jgi:hypothetical protein